MYINSQAKADFSDNLVHHLTASKHSKRQKYNWYCPRREIFMKIWVNEIWLVTFMAIISYFYATCAVLSWPSVLWNIHHTLHSYILSKNQHLCYETQTVFSARQNGGGGAGGLGGGSFLMNQSTASAFDSINSIHFFQRLIFRVFDILMNWLIERLSEAYGPSIS